MKSSNNLSERKPPWPFKRPTNKCGVICIVLGILFLLNAMLSTFFRLPLSDFLGMYENIFKVRGFCMSTGKWVWRKDINNRTFWTSCCELENIL